MSKRHQGNIISSSKVVPTSSAASGAWASGATHTGGNGGSGLVIIRYLTSQLG